MPSFTELAAYAYDLLPAVPRLGVAQLIKKYPYLQITLDSILERRRQGATYAQVINQVDLLNVSKKITR